MPIREARYGGFFALFADIWTNRARFGGLLRRGRAVLGTD